MAKTENALLDLARRGQLPALDEAWLAKLDDPQADQAAMLDTLAILTKDGKSERAAALGWSWLEAAKEKLDPRRALDLGRELLLRLEASSDLRQEVVGLYREVYADRENFETLLEASGLAGGKSPRRALRTLEICLNLAVGDYLISRSDESVVQLVELDQAGCTFTVQGKRSSDALDADGLALAYDPVDANDFRVLLAARPDQLRGLLENDPATLVVGVLQSRQGQIDSDTLEHLLVPRLIRQDQWSGWWSKARTALRRHPQVVLEGRNPVILTHHAAGLTLEQEIEPQWTKANTWSERMAVIEAYLREAKARKVLPEAGLVKRMYHDINRRLKVSRKGAPAEALTEALLIERLVAEGLLPDGVEHPAAQILAEAADLKGLLERLGDHRLYVNATELLRRALPDRWADLYLELLPTAPQEACEPMAQALAGAGRIADLQSLCLRAMDDLDTCLDLVCWLWIGPGVTALEPLPRRELLPRMLEYLAQLNRADGIPHDKLRNARLRMRAALSADSYAHYREVIEQMGPGLASTVHRTVDRMEGLGQVVHSRLLRIVRDRYPEMFLVRTRFDAWTDTSTIFCTAAGLRKREEDLNFLLNVKIPENAKAIGDAAAHGDLSENSEYKFALEERDLLQARLRTIRDELAIARVINADDVLIDQVSVGARVSLTATDGTDTREFTILGPWEADLDQKIYNYQAPLCQKLKNKKIGDVVTLEFDTGEREYRLNAIANALA